MYTERVSTVRMVQTSNAPHKTCPLKRLVLRLKKLTLYDTSGLDVLRRTPTPHSQKLLSSTFVRYLQGV